MDSLAANDRFMGSLVVRKNGQVLYSRQIGWADREARIPIKADTRLGIGSISKTYTAALTMMAVQEGKVKLDQPLSSFVENQPGSERIRIRHLLMHRSGIHNFTDDSLYLTYHTRSMGRKEMLRIIREGGLDFPADSTARYSNSNYVLLSFILEDLYRKPFDQLLQEKILNPLSLTQTCMGQTCPKKNPPAQSYTVSDNRFERSPRTDPSIPLGAGAIQSTADEVARLYEALLQGRLITAQWIDTLCTPRDGYGMGIFPIPFFNRKGLGHTGGIDGFHSFGVYFPDDSLSYAILSNGLSVELNAIHIAVLSAVYGKHFLIPSFRRITISPDYLTTLTGTYACPDIPLDMEVILRDGTLYAQATGQSEFPLEAKSKDTFRFEPADVTLVFTPETGTMLLLQRGMTFTFHKKN